MPGARGRARWVTERPDSPPWSPRPRSSSAPIVGLRVPIGARALGLLMGLGAGALISSLAFELAEEAIDEGGFVPLALGLADGRARVLRGDRLLERGVGPRPQAPPARRRHRGARGGAARARRAARRASPERSPALGIGLADRRRRRHLADRRGLPLQRARGARVGRPR